MPSQKDSSCGLTGLQGGNVDRRGDSTSIAEHKPSTDHLPPKQSEESTFMPQIFFCSLSLLAPPQQQHTTHTRSRQAVQNPRKEQQTLPPYQPPSPPPPRHLYKAVPTARPLQASDDGSSSYSNRFFQLQGFHCLCDRLAHPLIPSFVPLRLQFHFPNHVQTRQESCLEHCHQQHCRRWPFFDCDGCHGCRCSRCCGPQAPLCKAEEA